MTSSLSTNGSSEPVAGQVTAAPRSQPRRRRQRGSLPRALNEIGVAVSVAVLVAAPLFAGGVHRSTMIGLMCASVLGLACLSGSLALQGRQPRTHWVVLLPALLLAIPLVQSIPLPFGLRGLLDPRGTALLRDNQSVVMTAWPLSLDPVATRVNVGRAAASLAAFVFAYHLAAGQTRRNLVLHAVGITGVAAVAIGVGHRVFGVDRLYGLFRVPVRSLLTGPFVNSNHTSELLELAAFVCLACALQRRALLHRSLWLLAAVLCGGGAAATLSRGAGLGLAVGAVTFAALWYRANAEKQTGGRRAAALRAAAFVALVAVGLLSLGADQLVGRFQTDGVSTDLRFRLWRDGWRVLVAHPSGIGRGAFDRIFPIYRSLRMPFAIRFAFLENEPLQYLVDCGWVLFLLILALSTGAALRIARHGRRDVTEAALCAGLVAVLGHSLVDFGLETLGVLLPFSAVAGTVLGRLHPAQSLTERAPRARLSWVLAGLACFGLFFGIASTAHSSNDDFDGLVKGARTRAEKLAVTERAERTHPLDYFYALDRARLEPLAGSPSPRLHELNRALRLCPSCDTVHAEIARNLWTLGLHQQALLEWRTAVSLQPVRLRSLLDELFVQGAKPEQLASLSSGNPERMLEVADFVAARGSVPDAFVVLDQADAMGAPRGETLLRRATLNLSSGKLDEAARDAAAAAAAGAQGPRLPVLRAQILLKQKQAEGADEALAILDEAAVRYPTDLQLQRERVSLVTRYSKWTSAARSIEGLKLACYRAMGSAAEAHEAAANISLYMGRLNDALDEYRMALADRSNDVALWIAYARAAETAGRPITARDAYNQAARISPKDPTISRALQNLDESVARLRLQDGGGPSHFPPGP